MMETVVIKESRGKNIRLLLLMLGAAVLCTWTVTTPETTFQPHKRHMTIVLSAIALPFLAAGIGIILGRLVRPRPFLVLTAEGFEFSSGFRNLRFIPWQEVSDISLIKIRSAKILGVALRHREKYTGTSAGQDFSLPIGSKWLGEYELSVSLGRINDSTEVFADYMISIDRNSASFMAGGYKIYCSYQGTVSEQNGRLIILCDKLIDGSGNLTAGDTLAILTFKAGNYYIESSIIYDNPDTGDSSWHLLTKTSQP